MVLAAISTAAHGKYKVQVKDDYSEPVNVWTCVALSSGEPQDHGSAGSYRAFDCVGKTAAGRCRARDKKAESEHATLSARIAQLRKMRQGSGSLNSTV